jgi:hypothetical protein
LISSCYPALVCCRGLQTGERGIEFPSLWWVSVCAVYKCSVLTCVGHCVIKMVLPFIGQGERRTLLHKLKGLAKWVKVGACRVAPCTPWFLLDEDTVENSSFFCQDTIAAPSSSKSPLLCTVMSYNNLSDVFCWLASGGAVELLSLTMLWKVTHVSWHTIPVLSFRLHARLRVWLARSHNQIS